MRLNYDTDSDVFDSEAYRSPLYPGIALRALGWETEPDEDTEWTGLETRTGKVVIVMVGDDQHRTADLDDLYALSSEDYCGGCGQIGCGHGK